ncbi:MAG: alpha-D-ribose 1-methylphosphonate 5-triphosphate diphosphatase PhnM [Saliniramus fredricksonii]|uniref:Ribose 1,5-bisphosphate phosphokinase PhnN n=1 Tax=Saliniramus fredricksonii TaxID=1653334 RepID=A0A0P7YBY6_9HYPH|nr:alpha-D-ribose 1-methylphosphonate 5-triphosphate diphosphatase [Saliniramus fredricksonii]KPQ11573.1 MAG: alpha-D-ribose 1-methylphosphonate 5-triphosphate diphosphatase PhnM [Saliniramus fredricksonii]SCC82479.1 phosphonate metabolism protein PhnM/phosphonate metabolism protein/1,5-bisphosphokinase (PRPP-forming) PhnN,TIGR02322 [Saliniramus fredricksonii]
MTGRIRDETPPTGRLVAVVGPSGAGKDALIDAALSQRPDLRRVRRVITRPADAGAEDHEAVDEAEFDRRRTRGEFAFHWQAHGLAYGIPRAALAPLNEGRTLIFNGSRAALAAAQAHDPSLAVVVITADDETLARRLAARGRETPDGIAARLARGRFPAPVGAHIVENDADLTTGVARFLAVLDAITDNTASADNSTIRRSSVQGTIHETILGNARLILPGEVITGSIVIRDGVIAAIDPGPTAAPGAIDCEGDCVAPGLIELHTDNLERHMTPRPGVDWPHMNAIIAHDAELAGVGITTVFDALRIGSEHKAPKVRAGYKPYARSMASEILAMVAKGALRISHYLHLRAEICSDTLIDEIAEFSPDDRVGIVSMMDHTPGQRQFADLDRLRTYMVGKHGIAPADFETYIAERQALGNRVRAAHEAAAVAGAQRLGAILASHDDTTTDHVTASAAHGAGLAEFPTTLEAARACHAHGIAVMMGGPNLIRGGSHSGNVSALEAAEAGLLDIISSDYIPASLLMGAIALARQSDDLPAGIATVTRNAARAAGLTDRGALEPGLRADIIRFREVNGTPVVRGTWVKGKRVA